MQVAYSISLVYLGTITWILQRDISLFTDESMQ